MCAPPTKDNSCPGLLFCLVAFRQGLSKPGAELAASRPSNCLALTAVKLEVSACGLPGFLCECWRPEVLTPLEQELLPAEASPQPPA